MKYKLIESDISGLFRIKALIDFADVRAGDIGGYVESEENLSHYNNCWIYDNSKSIQNSIVSENARILNNSTIKDNAHCKGSSVVSNSTISNNAVLRGRATIKNGIATKSPLNITKGGKNITICDNSMTIECLTMTIEEWRNLKDEDYAGLHETGAWYGSKFKELLIQLEKRHNG